LHRIVSLPEHCTQRNDALVQFVEIQALRTLGNLVRPGDRANRHPIDSGLLMRKQNRLSDYDNDNDNDCLFCFAYQAI